MSDVIRAEEKVLNQQAVYWELDRFDANGQAIYKQPVQIKCRWEDINEQFVGPDGKDHVSSSIVMVDRNLVVQGVIWLGKLADLDSQTSPFDNLGAYEIKKFDRIPNRKANKFYREVYL